MGDSGKNIFVRGRFEISGNRSEISERGVKFLGQVSFIRDSGENIFSRPFQFFWNRSGTKAKSVNQNGW